jgi:ferrous iron transport protein A
MNLRDVTPGFHARVSRVSCEDALAERLMEMGLVPGVSVEVVRPSRLGSPMQIRVLGYCLSLRAAEAAFVELAA